MSMEKTEVNDKAAAMRGFFVVVFVSASLVLPASLDAQQGQPPPNATARCKDGTYSTSKTARGTCSGHKGVAEWLAPADATAQCKDGTYSTSTTRRGTCSNLGGVAAWLATARCSDGTLYKAEARQGACSGHGGVAEWLEEPRS
jgi:uncharacterized protein with FMN-binding domain